MILGDANQSGRSMAVAPICLQKKHLNTNSGKEMKSEKLFALAVALFVGALSPSADATVINVVGTNSSVGNCIPFGCPGFYDPFMGFVYKNLPAFTLNPGDTIAFDTGATNDNPLQFNILMGATTTNGGTVIGGGGLTSIVSAQTPADPDGNAVTGDFELVFTVDNVFSFSGGGLVIAFNPTGPSPADETGEQNLYQTDSTDPSGFFVGRFFGYGSLPANFDVTSPATCAQGDCAFTTDFIANFVITTQTVPEPASLALFGLGFAGLGLSRRRKT